MPAYDTASLTLYCDNLKGDHRPGEFPHLFEGKTNSECRAEARYAGWRIYRNFATLCPRCKKPKGIIYDPHF